MRVTCPTCRLAGLIDADPVAVMTRVVCARCETSYEALPVDGEMQTFLSPSANDAFPPAQFSTEGPKGFMLEGFDDVLSIPQEPCELRDADVQPQDADVQPLVLDELFVAPETHSPDAFAERAPQVEKAPVELPAPSEEAAQSPLHVTDAPEAETPTPNPSPQLSPAPKHAPQGYDKYAVGVRLLKLSPAWLLIASAGFVAVIFLCSWVARPVSEAETLAPGSALLNQATNANAAANSAQTSESLRPAALPSEPAAVASKETGASKETVATKETGASAAQPVAEMKGAEQQVSVEERKAEHESAAPQTGGDAAGKFTVQVGSYSDASEANARVSSLRAAGFEARSVAAEIPKRGTWHRVQAGRFPTREEAARAGAQLRAKSLADSPIVTEAGK
ncbi:MAG TPA: SPOR domain-containing protein [Pyrinomonadaceae bacterium]|nr:SPOR domain-containing protein [Pyrinomonadaceae bacterium]